ncbi:DMT family transporter [Parvibium lacunae]|uniref:DMT family transporter n=1 Tax=Parvibium lacunae TaxID=1888893 RepID=A0A368L7Q5_9BURK|nr:DMT family transporter [Parvibium lacunae]RCS59683.1 DMT family transporter [Parvibium lacunae]
MAWAHLVELILLAAIWGASFLFMRIAVPVFGAVWLIEYRVLFAAIFLGLIALWQRRPLSLRGNLGHFLIVGAINTAIPFVLFAYAAQTLPASLLSIFNALAPIFGALAAALWLRSPLTSQTMLGLSLGFLGVGVLTADYVQQAHLNFHSNQVWYALLAATLAPLCYGIATAYTKWRSAQVEAFSNAHLSMWAAVLILFPLAYLSPAPQVNAVSAWLPLIALGVICTGLAYVLYFRLVAAVGPVKTLTVTFLIPVFGVLWGVLFLHESLTWWLPIGGFFVLLGSALVNGIVPTRWLPK